MAIDGVTDVITKRQSLHVNYRANGIEDARSIIIDSHTSNRDNIGVGETVELISGKSTISVAISGVFDNDSIPTDGHGTLHFDAPLEYAPEAFVQGFRLAAGRSEYCNRILLVRVCTAQILIM